MCLYPKLITNRKYLPNKKNNWKAPICRDERLRLVPIGCQQCIECKKQKARQWSVRLQEEIRTNKHGEFITLTFSNESIKELKDKVHETFRGLEGYELDNAIATLGMRLFLERWRKKYKISVKHWMVTELGHNGTENIHLHGIIFKRDKFKNVKKGYKNKYHKYLTHFEKYRAKLITQQKEDITKIWKYGYVYTGEYVNERTINYISKYITKQDPIHRNYNAKILTSAGMGEGYTKRFDAQLNKYKKGETKEYYTTRQGVKLNLPIYWRNKIYSEEEREKLWIEKIEKEERWVNGIRISTKNGPEQYYKILKYAQRENVAKGYGTDQKDWNKIFYENQRRKIQMKKRLEKIEPELANTNVIEEYYGFKKYKYGNSQKRT